MNTCLTDTHVNLFGTEKSAFICLMLPKPTSFALVLAGLHTTTALIVNEWEEGLLEDIKHWLNQLAPADLSWKHNDLHLRPNIPEDEPRNAHAHLQALLLGNHLTVSVQDAQLVLGRYQDVILVELDGPRRRQVGVSFLGA